jgi:hypothetical protein
MAIPEDVPVEGATAMDGLPGKQHSKSAKGSDDLPKEHQSDTTCPSDGEIEKATSGSESTAEGLVGLDAQEGAKPPSAARDADTSREPVQIPQGPATGTQEGATPSGWDEDEVKPAEQASIPEGPVVGTQEGATPSGFDSDEGEQPKRQHVPKGRGGVALEFDMGAGPCKKAPKALADRLSKRRPLKPLKKSPPAPTSAPFGRQSVGGLDSGTATTSGTSRQADAHSEKVSAIPDPTPDCHERNERVDGETARASARDLLTDALMGTSPAATAPLK